MDITIENDKEVERLGSNAAGEYMLWHASELEKLACRNDEPMSADFLVPLAKRLYLTFRSNISHPVDYVGGSILKGARWATVLTCMNGRIPDFNFITLLRPYANSSYQDQQSELLVVPRAQFLLVEIARVVEGCYGADWRRHERLRLSRSKFGLDSTTAFSVLAPKVRSVTQKCAAFRHELKRQRDQNEENQRIARRGDQFDHCVPAPEATILLPNENEGIQQMLADAMAKLKGDSDYVVLDNILDADVSNSISDHCLHYFSSEGDRRILAQSVHRGDHVCFIDVFDAKNNLAKILQPATRPLVNVTAKESLCQYHIPKLAQLSLYNGLTEKAGYVAHRDNVSTTGDDGENYREITAILYLNDVPDGCSGGLLRCYETSAEGGVDGATFHDVVPKAGRMVIFQSRKLLHEVTPVIGWQRLAVSLWILKDSREKQ